MFCSKGITKFGLEAFINKLSQLTEFPGGSLFSVPTKEIGQNCVSLISKSSENFSSFVK